MKRPENEIIITRSKNIECGGCCGAIDDQFNIMADQEGEPRHGLVKAVKINPRCVQLRAN